MTEKELRNFLIDKIPVTESLGFEVLKLSPLEVQIKAPLSLNKNHMDSAFGGSLSTLMILTCYSWLFGVLGAHGSEFHIVIKDATTKFMIPVTEDIVVVCRAPDIADVKKFLDAYDKKGIARIKLNSCVELSNQSVACQLEGTFVATK